MADFLTNVYTLYALILERTGFEARLGTWAGSLPATDRASWAAVLATAAMLGLYGALASGDDTLVKTFRAATFVLATTLPLAAWRLSRTPAMAPFAGLALLVLLLCGLVHRLLASRRKEGLAATLFVRTCWAAEALGVGLFATVAGFALTERDVPLRLAFWALFLLRVSTADLLAPARLAEHLGLKASAMADLKKAVGRPKRKTRGPAESRAWRGLAGLGKLLVVAVWLTLPLLAALAPAEVAHGEWPEAFLLLHHYPPFALGLTALVIFAISLFDLADDPIDGLRGMTASVATLLYLGYVFQDPAFAEYRHSLPGLYLVETLAAFLLGVVRRR